MAKAGQHGMGHGTVEGHQHVGTTDPAIPDEGDLGAQIHNENKRYGDDARGADHRKTQAGSTDEAEGVVESFEKLDPKARSGEE
ncbi:hypothetical protein SAMN05216548_1294 [Faunimonas pinastri]|uniref:Uncharacterized protein n=1 Tax=Faunimonas pinastri TaxID=1855383 RepID=A0A1H9QH53_9HYPH|nr:hypothetical protein [Faunimonas pinastri]SER59881.1 hypothetical protein SAMN05216548_1294 [Faunimonas pinastri]